MIRNRKRVVDTFVARNLKKPERQLATDCLEYYAINADCPYETIRFEPVSRESIILGNGVNE